MQRLHEDRAFHFQMHLDSRSALHHSLPSWDLAGHEVGHALRSEFRVWNIAIPSNCMRFSYCARGNKSCWCFEQMSWSRVQLAHEVCCVKFRLYSRSGMMEVKRQDTQLVRSGDQWIVRGHPDDCQAILVSWVSTRSVTGILNGHCGPYPEQSKGEKQIIQ